MHLKNARIHRSGVSNLDFRTKGLLPPSKEYMGFSLRSLSHCLGSRSYSQKSLAPVNNPPDEDFMHTAKRLSSLENTLVSTSQKKLPPLRRKDLAGTRDIWSHKQTNDMYPTTHSKRNVKKVSNLLPPEQKSMLEQTKLPNTRDLGLDLKHQSSSHIRRDGETKMSEKEAKQRVKRVNYLRTMLRNRYMNRSNLMGMFRSWDKDTKGYLDARDIHYMLNSIGIKCNLDETSCLVACADLNSDKRISAAQFMHMVISYDDKVALDPRKVDVKQYLDPVILEDQFREKEMKNRELKEINQMKYFIKNKIPQAALKFKMFDRAEQEQGLESQGLSKSYTVTYDGFVKALNKLQLP